MSFKRENRSKKRYQENILTRASD